MNEKKSPDAKVPDYVHGYATRENQRLIDQARTLADLLHSDSVFPPGSRILEAGCGVGAQTVTLAAKNPEAHITSIDISGASLKTAQARIKEAGFNNVTFQQADLFHLPFRAGSFDHVFLCFVLEHLPDARAALHHLMEMLRPGGSLVDIEGDHGSTFFHPPNPEAQKTIDCLVRLQAMSGGDAWIGRRLFPLMREAGLQEVTVSPRFVYADASRPAMVEGFTLKTFAAMVEGVREPVLAANLIDVTTWEVGIAGLRRAAEADGVFCYTFFKVSGVTSW